VGGVGRLDPGARVRAVEEVTLDDEPAAHRFVDVAEDVTVGLPWAWPPGREPVPPARDRSHVEDV
jgi:hypothetical protein